MDTSCILTQVDEWLARTGNRTQRIDAGWFHPSSLSNPCMMAVALDFLGYPKPKGNIEPRIQRVFSIGHGVDRAWKERLKKSGLSVVGSAAYPSLKMEIPEWRIHGECDDIIQITNASGMDPLIAIAEVKSINQRGFDGALPLSDHIIQTHCYMKGHGLRDAFVIYENKNDSQVKVVHVPWDDAVWYDITMKISNIIGALQSAEGFLFKECKYECQFGETCSTYNPEDGRTRLEALGLIK